MHIRAATLQDAAEICVVLHRSITELCVADHENDPQKLGQWLTNKTEDNLAKWIAQQGQAYFVAIIGDTIAGVGAVSLTTGILLNYITPDYQYRGVSKAIMVALEGWLIEQKQRCSRLSSTVTARRFYESLGYRPDEDAGAGSASNASFPMVKRLQ